MRAFPRYGTPESFGLLRRPSRDEGDLLAWEWPSGEVILLFVGVRRLVRLLPSLPPVPDYAAARR